MGKHRKPTILSDHVTCYQLFMGITEHQVMDVDPKVANHSFKLNQMCSPLFKMLSTGVRTDVAHHCTKLLTQRWVNHEMIVQVTLLGSDDGLSAIVTTKSECQSNTNKSFCAANCIFTKVTFQFLSPFFNI